MTIRARSRPIANDVKQLLDKSDAELDALFSRSEPGPIPQGVARGTAIVANDTRFANILARIVHYIGWRGKTFDSANGILRNRFTALGFNAIAARVYVDASLLDGKPCIVLDYSTTSRMARHIRDEIRLVAPGTYLGRVYWKDKPTVHFALRVPRAAPHREG